MINSNANTQTLGDRAVADEKDGSARKIAARETTSSQPNACVVEWKRAEPSVESGHAVPGSNGETKLRTVNQEILVA